TCLIVGLLLGLAGHCFGLGPDVPARTGYFDPDYFRHHGGLTGEGLYWTSHTLFQQFGTDIFFIFLMLGGLLLLTGASVAGIVRATGESLTRTTQRVKQSTSEFAALVGTRPAPDPAPRPLAVDDEQVDDGPPEVEPVVRATHVEAPALDGEERYPDLFGPEEPTIEQHEEEEDEAEVEDDVAGGVAAVRNPEPPSQEELTPQGNRRSAVTEAD